MKTYTYETYDIHELKEKFPEGFEYALEKWQEDCWQDIFWMEEICDSMKKLFHVAGINLRDWELGANCPNYVSFDDFDVEIDNPDYDEEDEDSEEYIEVSSRDIYKKDAEKWIKDFILNGATWKRETYEYENEKKKIVKGFRYDIKKKDGSDWSCEFTGVCFDHDFIDDLLENVRLGESLYDSLKWLADKCGKLIEQELETQQTEEYFIDHADANQYEFTEDGEMAQRIIQHLCRNHSAQF